MWQDPLQISPVFVRGGAVELLSKRVPDDTSFPFLVHSSPFDDDVLGLFNSIVVGVFYDFYFRICPKFTSISVSSP